MSTAALSAAGTPRPPQVMGATDEQWSTAQSGAQSGELQLEGRSVVDQLNEMKAQGLHGLVEEIDDGKGGKRKWMFLTSSQALDISKSHDRIWKMIDLLGIKRPKLVINLLHSWGGVECKRVLGSNGGTRWMNNRIPGFGLPGNQYLTAEDGFLAEERIAKFLKQVILPLAADTHAIILCSALDRVCLLTSCLLRVVAMEKSKWGSRMPFTVVHCTSFLRPLLAGEVQFDKGEKTTNKIGRLWLEVKSNSSNLQDCSDRLKEFYRDVYRSDNEVEPWDTPWATDLVEGTHYILADGIDEEQGGFGDLFKEMMRAFVATIPTICLQTGASFRNPKGSPDTGGLATALRCATAGSTVIFLDAIAKVQRDGWWTNAYKQEQERKLRQKKEKEKEVAKALKDQKAVEVALPEEKEGKKEKKEPTEDKATDGGFSDLASPAKEGTSPPMMRPSRTATLTTTKALSKVKKDVKQGPLQWPLQGPWLQIPKSERNKIQAEQSSAVEFFKACDEFVKVKEQAERALQEGAARGEEHLPWAGERHYQANLRTKLQAVTSAFEELERREKAQAAPPEEVASVGADKKDRPRLRDPYLRCGEKIRKQCDELKEALEHRSVSELCSNKPARLEKAKCYFEEALRKPLMQREEKLRHPHILDIMDLAFWHQVFFPKDDLDVGNKDVERKFTSINQAVRMWMRDETGSKDVAVEATTKALQATVKATNSEVRKIIIWLAECFYRDCKEVEFGTLEEGAPRGLRGTLLKEKEKFLRDLKNKAEAKRMADGDNGELEEQVEKLANSIEKEKREAQKDQKADAMKLFEAQADSWITHAYELMCNENFFGVNCEDIEIGEEMVKYIVGLDRLPKKNNLEGLRLLRTCWDEYDESMYVAGFHKVVTKLLTIISMVFQFGVVLCTVLLQDDGSFGVLKESSGRRLHGWWPGVALTPDEACDWLPRSVGVAGTVDGLALRQACPGLMEQHNVTALAAASAGAARRLASTVTVGNVNLDFSDVALVLGHMVFLLSVCATAVISLNSYFDPLHRWRLARAGAACMESIIWQYRTRIGPFQQVANNPSAPEKALFDALQNWRSNFRAEGSAPLERKYPHHVYMHGQYDDPAWARPQFVPTTKMQRLARWWRKILGRKNIFDAQQPFGTGPESEPLKDDHQSPVKPEDYLKRRLNPKMIFYQNRLPSYNRAATRWYFCALLLSAFGSVLAYVRLPLWVTLVSAITQVVVAWTEFSDYVRKSERYTAAILAIKGLRAWWDSLTPAERASSDIVTRLIQEGERVITDENQRWSSSNTSQKVAEAHAPADTVVAVKQDQKESKKKDR